MGQAKRHEVRIMGLGLVALAMLAMLLVLWSGVSLAAQLRSHTADVSVSHGTGSP